MTNREDHEKKMDIIQQEIEAAHKRITEKANDTLRSISDNYQNKLLEKIAEEMRLAKEAVERDDAREAEQHRIRAEVYKSALDAMRR